MTRYRIAAATAAAALAVAACSSSSSPATHSTAASVAPSTSSAVKPGHAGITISNFAYSGTMTVQAGQKVTVTNNDSTAHTLTDKKTHLFDTGNIAANGGTGTFTAPKKPGTYPFGCTYHPQMAGTLIVK
jgi:plastocyanin